MVVTTTAAEANLSTNSEVMTRDILDKLGAMERSFEGAFEGGFERAMHVLNERLSASMKELQSSQSRLARLEMG